jgi:CheY-like chemotaxis protein
LAGSEFVDLSGKRVLVAEDNTVNQLVIQGMLARYHITPELVSNGAQALELVRQGKPYDLILMDCEMPLMNGFDAATAIRAWEQSQGARACPMLALTAHVLPEELARCTDSGMDGHLAKPIEKKALHQLLMQLST